MPDDLLTRLIRTTRLYLHDSDPQNGVPRTIVLQTKNRLLNLLEETEKHLRASASPRDNNPVNPVNPVQTESTPK